MVYFRNEGNKAVSLSLSSSNWVFRDLQGNMLSGGYQQYFSLGWDYDYSRVAVDEVRRAVFTLAVLPGLVDVSTFSFELVVTLSG